MGREGGGGAFRVFDLSVGGYSSPFVATSVSWLPMRALQGQLYCRVSTTELTVAELTWITRAQLNNPCRRAAEG